MQIYEKINKIINKYNKFIIMTHKNPDLDGLSSAICLHEIIKTYDKSVAIYIGDEIKNTSVLKMFKKLEEMDADITYINKTNYKDFVSSSTLLIILDVNKEQLVENSNLLHELNNILVIDHHLNTPNAITNTIYTYVDPNLSSIAEFMTNYVKYLNKEIDPLFATILLAAIEIDTNSFNIKTSVDTHLTAAYLLQIGADNIEKQELLQENRYEYLNRQSLLKNSFMIKNNILCTFDGKIYKKDELAKSAEQLLKLDEVESSYVIGRISNNKIGISARSLGNVNVEKVMKKFGGGGHLTEAAAEIEGNDIEYVKEQLIKEVMR